MAGLTTNSEFQRFKAICVPLLVSSKLTPRTISTVSSLLSALLQLLRETDPVILDERFIGYIFFPLKSIFERNASAEIPDQVLEKVLLSLSLLCDAWWWTCDLGLWKQILILCGSVLGELESKGKARSRDDETKEAAVQCLISLLRKRTEQDAIAHGKPIEAAEARFNRLRELASTLVPIIGQTLDYILRVTLSPRQSLQRSSTELLYTVIDAYAPEDMIPTVIPGLASGMTKVCLGTSSSTNKGWVNGDIVAAALKVLRISISKAVGDEVCMREGALPRFEDLEDLASFGKSNDPKTDSDTSAQSSILVTRTQPWLRATASQLHIALNSLSPLVKHPTPSALYALIDFSTHVLSSTMMTLPQTQPLLLSFLLSTANSDYQILSLRAIDSLKGLLAAPKVGTALLQQLAQITTDNLSSLPRLLSSQSGVRVQHVAEMITSTCRVGLSAADDVAVASISKVIGKLLGPTGGIEKWGWNLLSVLEFKDPPITETQNSSSQLLLESNSEPTWVPFPELVFKNVSSHETKHALETMLQALGQAGGDSCLFSVEWFVNVGRSGTQSRSVAAMWCACRLLEGVADLQLSSESSLNATVLRRSRRLEKQVRALARSVVELWDKSDFEDLSEAPQPDYVDEKLEFGISHQKGLVPLDETLKIFQAKPTQEEKRVNQPVLHRSISLQLIAIAAGVLQSRFDSLFIFTIYPILHSIVSPASFLSLSGLAALNYVSIATSYASPANLLLSNFDYALDSVSRRLARRWLDIDATKVLVILVRLVGRDVVDKAGDVVEECFDRLDAFHGYNIIVDGLVEVLLEVLNVIDMDVKANGSSAPEREEGGSQDQPLPLTNLDALFGWLPKRHIDDTKDGTDYGPAPQKAWGKQKAEGEIDADDEPEFKTAKGSDEPPPTASQLLTKQIISRSLYFLTHESPIIRARILSLLNLSVPVLPESALLPSINNAWPFILNRLSDNETFVVSRAITLVESLASHVGSFMYRRVWDDLWPRFQTILKQLGSADSINALARRTAFAVGTESAYTHSHRLYRSLINTMTSVMRGVHTYDPSYWEALVLFRRFLGQHVHDELQQCAKLFYLAAGEKNADAVWLVLDSTITRSSPLMDFMYDGQWHIEKNAVDILQVASERVR